MRITFLDEFGFLRMDSHNSELIQIQERTLNSCLNQQVIFRQFQDPVFQRVLIRFSHFTF
jgi:hypothetical protein